MIYRFLLFMRMFLTGLFKFTVREVARLTVVIGVLIMAEIIARVKILSIILLIVLAGVIAFALFLIAGDSWDNYKRERDIRDL